MISKTITELRSDITTDLSLRLPNLDLTEGTPERDLFIESPISGQLINLWNNLIYTAKLHAPILYYQDLTDDDIVNYCLNYNVTRRAATYATGTILFYTYTEPTQDIYIDSGTVVTTLTTPTIDFEVTANYSIPYISRSSYYNSISNRWEIECAVSALESGSTIRAGVGTVTKISDPIIGIEGCTNESSITGGEDEETSASMLQRVIDKYQGRGLGSTIGIKSYVENYASTVSVIGTSDPLMERDEGYGGCIDVYIIGEDIQVYSETFYITSSGLYIDDESAYTSTSIVLTMQPVKSISSVLKNSVALSSTYFSLVEDTGMLKLSTESHDKMELTSTGISAIGPFLAGDEVTITYTYNDLLHTIQDDLESTENHYENRDYLVREMAAVTINTYLKIKEATGYDFDTEKPTWQLDIATYINNIKNEGSVELADVIGTAKNEVSVDNLDLTTADLENIGGGTKTAQGDILLGVNTYPVSGTVTIERWTS